MVVRVRLPALAPITSSKEAEMRHIYWCRGALTKPEVGRIELFCGIIRRHRILHAHLTSPDGRFTHCVTPDKLSAVTAASTYWEAQKIIRDC